MHLKTNVSIIFYICNFIQKCEIIIVIRNLKLKAIMQKFTKVKSFLEFLDKKDRLKYESYYTTSMLQINSHSYEQ